MKDLFDFLLDIFMLKRQDKNYIGLSRLNGQEVVALARVPKPVKQEVKISDLMRRVS